MITTLLILNLVATGYLVYRLVIGRNGGFFVKPGLPELQNGKQATGEKALDYIRRSEETIKNGDTKQTGLLLERGFQRFPEDPELF